MNGNPREGIAVFSGFFVYLDIEKAHITELAFGYGHSRFQLCNASPEIDELVFGIRNHVVGKQEGYDAQYRDKDNQAPHSSLKRNPSRFHSGKFIIFGQIPESHYRSQQYRQWKYQRNNSWHGKQQELQHHYQIQVFTRKLCNEQPNRLENKNEKQDYKYRGKCSQERFQ